VLRAPERVRRHGWASRGDVIFAPRGAAGWRRVRAHNSGAYAHGACRASQAAAPFTICMGGGEEEMVTATWRPR